ncbi:MAG TPA: flotillin family protein, partial [Verrucomicrobiota bacterium]|nr:flotillin family protein [Verrucomicrobiota bacterium]
MNTIIALLGNPGSGLAIIAAIIIVIVVIMGIAIVLSRYTKVGPNEVLVVSGRKHRHIDPDGVE